jgi:hypothetical protein
MKFFFETSEASVAGPLKMDTPCARAQSVALGLIVPVDRDGDPHLAQIAQQT